jgi:hypothetical protein
MGKQNKDNMKLDFKNWLVSECRSRFYKNFYFGSETSVSDLKWIAENYHRSDLGDAFYLEIQDEILSRCLLETNKQPTGRWIYSRIIKPVGQLKAGDDVGVSKPREGTWEVVHLDTNARAFVSEKELANYVKSVRDGNTPVMADSIEALRQVAATHRATQPQQPQQAQTQAKPSAAPAKGQKWIYAKTKQDIETIKADEDVGVVEAENGAWEIWTFGGQRMAATTKSDLPNVVQSVKQDDGKSIYSAPSLAELHDLVEGKLSKGKPNDADKKKHVLEHEKLSDEQRRIDARFEQMMSSKSQDHMMINALAGSGKAQPLDSKILTPKGWIRMGDIKVNNLVIGRDGKPHKVIGVFPQGMQEVVEVGFMDGSIVECSEDHLWLTECKRERVYCQQKGIPLFSYGKVLTTKEIAGDLLYRKQPKHYVPMVENVEFASQLTIIDPYLMGVLLGGGSFRTGCVSYSSEDKEIVESVDRLLPPALKSRPTGYGCDYRISSGIKGRKNEIVAEIKKLGLWRMGSDNKFVPDIYKFNTVETRAKVLSGLLDTDGEVGTHTIFYPTASYRLAKDIKFLVESLGGTGKITHKKTSYTYKGVKKSGKPCYRVYIKISGNPFSLKRKQEKYTPKTKYQPSRVIKSITSIGKKPCQCIAVDAKDNLYVTENCVVTHNTTMLKHLAWKYGKPGERWLYLVFNTKNKVEAQEKFPTSWVDVRTTNGFLGNLLKSNENVSRIDQTERMIEVLNKKRNKASEDEDEEEKSPMPRSKMGEIVDGSQFNEVLKKLGIVEDATADAIIEKMPIGEYSTTAAKSCAHSIRYMFKEVSQKVADLAKAYGVDPRKDGNHVKAELEKLFKGYDLDTGLAEIKERIRKYRSSSMVTEVLAALKKVYGFDFMGKNFKDEIAEAAEWLLKASLPKGTTQTLSFKGMEYDLGSMRDFSDDIWFAAINAHDMHWPHYDVVLADEVQDFNPCQKLMLEKLHGAGAKIVAVGDPNQAIYRFRGADGDAFHSLGRTLKELSGDKDTEHTLTTNYRSRKGILDHVNNMGHVTGLKHSESKYPNGGGGEVTNQDKEYGEVFTTLKKEHEDSKKGGPKMPETAFIARTNEPLVQAALKMLGDGVPFIIVGRDVSNELMRHIGKVLKGAKMRDDSPAIPHPRAGGRPNLGVKLEEYQKKENERFSSMNSKKAYLQEMNATSEALYSALAAFTGMSRDVEEMDDRAHDAMMRAVAAKPMPTVKDFKKWLKARLGGFDVQDNEADLRAFNEKVKKEHPVVLTTAHKSKGLEFSRVYILRDDQFPHPRATKEADKLQEENARYVAYTRAMDQLHIVKLKGQPGYRPPGGEE